MINVLSGVGMLLLLTVWLMLARFGDWNDVPMDTEEEK